MSKSKVAVIGAGPAGLTAAYQLAKAGVAVDVYEASDAVGGMCKTIPLWGQKVDLGPHRFFSSDKRVNSLWLEVIGRDYSMVSRLTRIHYAGKFFRYPLKAFDALGKLGVMEAARCTMSYLLERFSGKVAEKASSFEQWVVSRFGRRLFEIFFKSYSEKLWGISCQDLDADFAAQRIKKFSLAEAIRSAFSSSGRSGHKTLVDEFAYPHGGTGAVYERMAKAIELNGGRVLCNTPISRVLNSGSKITGIELSTGECLAYDQVISTMPLTQLVWHLDRVPAAVRNCISQLRFRNTILVYLRVDAKDLFPDNWLYVHSPELQMGRITNFRNWVPQICGESEQTILAIEYWCYDDEALWRSDETELVKLASEEIRKTGLVGSAVIEEGRVVRVPRCYPVYSRGYREHLQPVESYLDGLTGLTVIGRYGAFKYNNQDHSILMGLLAAENFLADAGHNLWDINTDYDAYQEEATITKSGLEVKPAPCPEWEPELASA